MALTQASLKGKLKTELSSVFNIIDASTLDKACGAIAQAIFDEFTTNAIIPSGIAVQVNPDSGIGSTTGTGTVA
jgi:hypothetical protein